MSKKKKKFKDIWGNQGELGRRFGISAVAVGKILKAAGLKEGSHTTERAIKEGYARPTPLKNGKPFYMWHLQKTTSLISQTHTPYTKLERCIAETKETVEYAHKLLDEGNDKIGYMILDDLYIDVPKALRPAVRAEIEALYG